MAPRIRKQADDAADVVASSAGKLHALPSDGMGAALDEAFGSITASTQDFGRHIEAAVPLAEILGEPRSMREAKARLQGMLPSVRKGETAKVVKDGKELYRYQYADLTDVSEAIIPLLSGLGLSFTSMPTMAVVPGDTVVRFVLKYTLEHISGDSEVGYWPLPDRADPQAVGSAITYARRYALCAVTGLAPGGDDDGTAAKESAGHGESLDIASLPSMPPREIEALLAALEPQARTPIAEYPLMWDSVVRRRATGKPSPVEHQGKLLPWDELFGLSIAQVIAQVDTPERWRDLFDQFKSVGAPNVPWTHGGISPAQRMRERAAEIKAEIELKVEVLSHAIQSATNLDELDVADRALTEAINAGILDSASRELLCKLRDESGHALSDEVIAQMRNFDHLSVAAWDGSATEETVDAALTGGRITDAMHAELVTMARDRAGLPDGSPSEWRWMAANAQSMRQLDGVVRMANEERQKPDSESRLTPKEAEFIYAECAKRRDHLGGKP